VDSCFILKRLVAQAYTCAYLKS